MRWQKKGQIYCPQGEHIWEKDTFMTPHARLMNDEVIRIWGGVRDAQGVSRIKYIDVSAHNPKEVLYVSDKVSLDVGKPGCFDDNGMILEDVLEVKGKLYIKTARKPMVFRPWDEWRHFCVYFTKVIAYS